MTENGTTRRGYVDTPGGQVHFREAGEGPTLVLLHQSPLSSRMYERVYPLLAASNIRAIGVDTPGYGMSDIPAAPPSITEYAELIAAAIVELDPGPVCLAGHHTGAAIAAELTVRRPSVVRALVLSGPPLFDNARRAAWSRQSRPTMDPRPDGSHLADYFQRRARLNKGWTDLAAMHRNVLEGLLNGPSGHYGHAAAFAFDMEPAVRAITIPTLIITNTGDDAYAESLRVHDLRPDWEFVELKGGSYDVVDEMTGDWVAAVSDLVGSASACSTSSAIPCHSQVNGESACTRRGAST